MNFFFGKFIDITIQWDNYLASHFIMRQFIPAVNQIYHTFESPLEITNDKKVQDEPSGGLYI